jgi:fatty-acid desaturase
MAVASSDGINPIEMPAESWVGKHNTAHAYTKEEQDMLKLAYKAAGLEYKDLNKGDMDSEELSSANTQSVVKPFKGYKRK